jgi:preprotein translocase subunit SecG
MTAVNIIEIVVSVLLVAAVLLQAKGGGLGGLVSGIGSSSTFRTRRGLEKTIFRGTIVLAVVFVVISIVSVKLS